MPFADIIRSANATIEDVADLIETIASASHDTVWTPWTPTYGASGSMTYTSVTTNVAKYIRLGTACFCILNFNGTTGGTASTIITATLPFTGSSYPGASLSWACEITPAGAGEIARMTIPSSDLTLVYVRRNSNALFPLGAVSASACFVYEV